MSTQRGRHCQSLSLFCSLCSVVLMFEWFVLSSLFLFCVVELLIDMKVLFFLCFLVHKGDETVSVLLLYVQLC